MIKEARDFRTKQEALWMELDYMREGNHYVYYDSVAREIRVVPTGQRKGVQRTVNLLRAKERGIVNLITRNEPAFNIRAELTPQMNDQEKEQAKKEADVYQYKCLQIYRDRYIQHKFKEAVKLGINRGLAVGQVVWNDDDDDADLIIHDPFEILIDPGCQGDIVQARFVIKEALVTMEYLQKEGYDHLDQVKKMDSERMSGSDYRQSFLQYKYNAVGFKNHYILREVWELVCEEVKEGSDGTQEIALKEKKYLKKTCLIGDVKIKEETYDGVDRYPFVLFYPELPLKELYPRPWFADLISLQKSLDALYSYTEEYIKTCAQGRYLLHDQTRFTTNINGEHGQQVKWSGVRPPEVMPIPPINQAIIEYHTNNTERYMSDIGGIQYMDVGAITGSNTSGRAIAQLQAQQSESVGEPTQNLAHFAEQVFHLFMYFIAYNYATPRTVQHPDSSKNEVFQIRGMGALTEIDDPVALRAQGQVLVDPDNLPKMRCSIIPGSAYSDLEEKADIKELFDMQVVDKETLLDAYKIGNVREVLDNLQKEQEAAAVMQAKQQQLQALTQEHGQLITGRPDMMAEQKTAEQLGQFAQSLPQSAPQETPQ